MRYYTKNLLSELSDEIPLKRFAYIIPQFKKKHIPGLLNVYFRLIGLLLLRKHVIGFTFCRVALVSDEDAYDFINDMMTSNIQESISHAKYNRLVFKQRIEEEYPGLKITVSPDLFV